jgi:RecJ-like exonuclease
MTYTQREPVATEPRHEPECRFCDGQGVVTVVEVEDCGGRVYGFKWDTENPGTPCPVCKLEMTLNGERLE